MKILLLGANGQLGTALRAALQDNENPYDLTHATRRGEEDLSGSLPVDLSSDEDVTALLHRVDPRIVVNAAAYTAVDRAESDEAQAIAINGHALGLLGRWARQRDALVVHVSTDYVFDGQESRPYLETDPTGPINAYGRSKLLGEQLLVESGARYLIFRTAWLYSAIGHSFFGTMLKLGAMRDELRVVSDQAGCPTSAGLLARAMATALDRWIQMDEPSRDAMTGIYHCVADGRTSWHGFATAIIDGAHARGILRRKPAVVAVASSEFPTPARRPRYSVLDNSRYKHVFRSDLANWEDALKSTLDELTFLNGSE